MGPTRSLATHVATLCARHRQHAVLANDYAHSRLLVASAIGTAGNPAAACSSATQAPAQAPNPVEAKYQQLVANGTLKADAKQQTVVQRLSEFYDDLLRYSHAHLDYQQQLDDYHREKQRRLSELQSLDKVDHADSDASTSQHQTDSSAAASSKPHGDASRPSTAGSAADEAQQDQPWSLKSVVNRILAGFQGSGRQSAGAKQLTPQQKQRVAARQREAQVRGATLHSTYVTRPQLGMKIWFYIGVVKNVLQWV